MYVLNAQKRDPNELRMRYSSTFVQLCRRVGINSNAATELLRHRKCAFIKHTSSASIKYAVCLQRLISNLKYKGFKILYLKYKIHKKGLLKIYNNEEEIRLYNIKLSKSSIYKPKLQRCLKHSQSNPTPPFYFRLANSMARNDLRNCILSFARNFFWHLLCS